MGQKPSYYVTTPIYYVNDNPHIGHAYTSLACDILARFKRLDGFDVTFLTGTDEHGQKVEKAAEAAGISPQSFTDKVSQSFRNLVKLMAFTNDDFIRTTEDRHLKACQALWKKMEDNGDIYLHDYQGWYSLRDEAFWAESELIKKNDGTFVAPTGATVEWVSEPSYFFRLSAWQDKLLDFYEKNPDFIAPSSRRNEVLSFVKGGLQDLSISRTSFKWGIVVPDNPHHIMYVWVDALTNYLTAAGYPDKQDLFQKKWPADLHMVGKDILRFHAVFWPAFLMSAGLDLPKRIFAHGWWTNEGQKISKSTGNVIIPHELVERFGLDPVRYFLMREVPFGNDGDFSERAIIMRMNSELANDFGNLVQRSLSMIYKNCQKQIPEFGDFLEEDLTLMNASSALLNHVRLSLDKQAFHEALDMIWKVIRSANSYVDHQAPWALKKSNPPRMGTVLYVLAETIRKITLLLQPFMPDSMDKILTQLSIPNHLRNFTCFETPLVSGVEIAEPVGIFPRYHSESSPHVG
jgi:methionyl-tRNA synthetase